MPAIGLRNDHLRHLSTLPRALQHLALHVAGRAGSGLTENERACIQTCTEIATLDRWIENILGAKTATEVLS